MRFLLALLFVGLAPNILAQKAAPAAAPPATPPEPAGGLFEVGRQLFEEFAPPEVKAEYEFPSRERWDAFAGRLQRAQAGESLEALAVYLPEAQSALKALRGVPGYEDYADWLDRRVDEIEGAKQATTPPRPSAPGAPKIPSPTRPAPQRSSALPHYDLWVSRVRGRPLPPRASELVPQLRSAFAAEGVPVELVWLAEAESTFNPTAQSPAGAKGLFQLMPETARSLGLDTFLPDERTHPEKSARAAARYLKTLYKRFGDWPLAIAAYNAGEGRVSRALTARSAKDFAAVANFLPAETRMYVPKVYALVALRTGVVPEKIPPPRL